MMIIGREIFKSPQKIHFTCYSIRLFKHIYGNVGYDYCTRPWIATMVNNKELLWAVFAPKLHPYTPLSSLGNAHRRMQTGEMERERGCTILNTLRARCPIYYLHLFIYYCGVEPDIAFSGALLHCFASEANPAAV